MPDTRPSPLPWHWVNYDGTDPDSGPARRELTASDGTIVLTAGPNVLYYDQALIREWSLREVRERRRREPGIGPLE